MTIPKVSATPHQAARLLADVSTVPSEVVGGHLTDDDFVCYSLDPPRLSKEETERLDAHLKSCDSCADQMERLLDIAREWRGEAGAARLEQLSQRIRALQTSSDDVVELGNDKRPQSVSWKVEVREWWYRIGPVRYAFVGLTAAVFALTATVFSLTRSLAFEKGRNSVLVQIPQANASVTSAAFDNTAAQRQLALFGLIQQLSSRDPRERVAALRTGQIMRLPYITDLAERHATVERDRTVREAATAIILESPNASAAIERVSSARTLRAELATPDVRRMLEDADGYVIGAASNGAAEAVRLYSEILGRLSTRARSALRAESVEAAKREAAARRFDEAAIRFKELFVDFQVTDEAPRNEK